MIRRAQGAGRLRLPGAAARHRTVRPDAQPRGLALDRQLLPRRRRDLAADGLPRRRRPPRGHEPGALRLARATGSSIRRTSSARPAPRATSRRSTTSATSSPTDPENVIFNQFAEFGNHIAHYLATGARARPRLRDAAGGAAGASAARVRLGDRLGRHDRRRRLPEGALRLADRRRRGARVPDDALQRLRRAQHPGDRRQAHPADPQRDEHRRRRRRLRPRDRPARRALRRPSRTARYLAGRRGVRRRTSSTRSPSLGLSSICNVLAAIKTAKHFGLGRRRRDRHRRHRRRRDVRQRARRSRSRSTSPTASTTSPRARCSASTCSAPRPTTCCELTHEERARIFNLGYYTWVEQQGVSLEDFEARRSQAFWTRTARAGRGVGRADRRVQRAHGRRSKGYDAAAPAASSAPAAARARRRRAVSVPLPERRRAATSTTCSVARSTRRLVQFPAGDEEPNPFIRYRQLLHAYHVARQAGWTTPSSATLVRRLDERVAAVDGHGFAVTPFGRSDELSDRLGFTRGRRRLGQGRDRQRLRLAQGPPPVRRARCTSRSSSASG